MNNLTQTIIPKGLLIGLAAILVMMGDRAFCATGTISVSPNHLALAAGVSGTTTVTWNATGTTAQVYVGDGANETLFAAGRSGSQPAAWIQAPNFYVFKLYDGTAHQTLLAWTSVNTQLPPASQFGIAYWPPLSTLCNGVACFGNATLNNANWPTQRPIVAADLDHICSLGGGIVRFMIWPQMSGFVPPTPPQPRGTFDPTFTEETTNIVELIGMCKQRGLQVAIGFGNNYFDQGPPCDANGCTPWWQIWWSNNFTNFLGDSLVWINGFVNAIEHSVQHPDYASAVIYYDYENEYYLNRPNMGWYVNFMHDWSAVPRGKRAESVLNVPNGPPTCATTVQTYDDPGNLKYNLTLSPPQGGRHLDYIDFHSYPLSNVRCGQPIGPPFNANIECCVDYIKGLFPDSTVLIGESGGWSTTTGGEGAQQSTVLNIAQRAQAKGVPYFLNWQLWDNTPGSPPCVGLGLGDSFHSPKDVLGGISSLLNILKNPDMELVSGSVPLNWTAAGTVATSLTSGYSATDAASNNRYTRLTVNGSGTAWIVSDLKSVKGGEPLYVNGFIRANQNIHDVSISVIQFNAAGVRTGSAGPAFTPWNFGWTWNNYLQRVGSWSVQLRSDTTSVQIMIFGTNSAGTGLIDIDTFSAWQRP